MSRFAHLLELMRCYGSALCLEGEGSSCTYAELLEQLELWQLRFGDLGVLPGAVVGVRSDYSISAVAVLLALLSRGAIVALVPRSCDVAQHLATACASAFMELKVDGDYEWNSISPPNSHPLVAQLAARNEGGMTLFTSGSTGRAKAALLSAERFLYKYRRPGRRFRTLAFLMFDHVAGLDTLFYTITSGGTLVITRRRDPRSIMEIIERSKVEVLPASPSFLRLLCAAEDEVGSDVSSLKIITFGSEPMDQSTLTRLSARFPDVDIAQKYGTTETGSPRSVSRGRDSLWLKIKGEGLETRVVENVLWIRSEGMMLGYLNAPSPFDAEGWYCTGDLVDVEGEWIRFRGRTADIINVGGEKVAPAEIEQLILELDFVLEVLVYGEPHLLMGQTVSAKVVIVPGSMEPPEATKRIRRLCRERVASYKVPLRVDIVTEVLTNDRQKLQRRPTAIAQGGDRTN